MGRKLVIGSVLVVVLGVLVWYTCIKSIPSPIVTVKGGQIQGVQLTSRGGRDFFGYYGIPFAKPPVGELRFKSPQPAKPWDGIWDASYNRPFCVQFEYIFMGLTIGSEDCLYLNVFVPAKAAQKGGKGLPVLAHIHGGYFHMGGTIPTGAKYFMDEDVILVTIAYRLGALGFLNTGDKASRGNMGLKDQNMALRWIQENIHAFGGDQTRVTIVGESAGGASVHYQMLSPKSEGLFWRAIRQSGSALNYWTMYRNSKEQAKRFAKKFKCPLANSEEMVECLRQVDANTFVKGHSDMLEFGTSPLISKFVPSIEAVKDEEAFLTEEPVELLKSGRFNKVPVLSGYNADEGLLHSPCLAHNQTKFNEVNDWLTWAPKSMHYNPEMQSVSAKLRDFYFGPNANAKIINSRKYIQNFTDMWGDRLFTVGVSQSAILEKEFVPSYLYFYDHRGGFNLGTFIGFSQSKGGVILSALMERLSYFYHSFVLGEDVEHELPGTAHADEFVMLYSGPIAPVYMSPSKDLQQSKDMVKLWVEFASGKKPLKFRDVEFLLNKKKRELTFLKLSDNPRMISEPFIERRLFWESLELPSE